MNSPHEDPFNLARFVEAQRSSYAVARDELHDGAKRSHWMWYIFPQVAGLGSSPTATFYALKSRDEARAYLLHPVLGRRLVECTMALLQLTGKTAEEVMGYPDCLKLRSCMTLFAAIAAPDSPFQRVLDRYFSGHVDSRTIDYLAAHESA
jgi:uncharacterized protein (DUF1810 family)